MVALAGLRAHVGTAVVGLELVRVDCDRGVESRFRTGAVAEVAQHRRAVEMMAGIGRDRVGSRDRTGRVRQRGRRAGAAASRVRRAAAGRRSPGRRFRRRPCGRRDVAHLEQALDAMKAVAVGWRKLQGAVDRLQRVRVVARLLHQEARQVPAIGVVGMAACSVRGRAPAPRARSLASMQRTIASATCSRPEGAGPGMCGDDSNGRRILAGSNGRAAPGLPVAFIASEPVAHRHADRARQGDVVARVVAEVVLGRVGLRAADQEREYAGRAFFVEQVPDVQRADQESLLAVVLRFQRSKPSTSAKLRLNTDCGA